MNPENVKLFNTFNEKKNLNSMENISEAPIIDPGDNNIEKENEKNK